MTGAFLAPAENLMSMGLDRKAVIVGYLVLEALDLGTHELQNGAALDADHVVMVGVPELVLESSETVSKLDGVRELSVDENLECSIDRRPSDSGMLAMDDPVQVIDGHVAARIEEVFEDGLSLFRVLEAVFREIGLQHTELFPRLLGRQSAA